MLIAEIGLAHDGSLGNALAFIDAVADAGAEAVKFQCHDGDPNTDPPASGVNIPQDSDRRAYWKRTAFGYREWDRLRWQAQSRNIQFGVTPFSIEALELVAPRCDFIKISRQHYASDLHRAASDTGKRCVATGGENRCGLGLNAYNPDFHLGISDHSATIWPCIRAAALGAEIFEVHVCWDRRAFGPDAQYSLTIDELATLAEGIKACLS